MNQEKRVLLVRAPKIFNFDSMSWKFVSQARLRRHTIQTYGFGWKFHIGSGTCDKDPFISIRGGNLYKFPTGGDLYFRVKAMILIFPKVIVIYQISQT